MLLKTLARPRALCMCVVAISLLSVHAEDPEGYARVIKSPNLTNNEATNDQEHANPQGLLLTPLRSPADGSDKVTPRPRTTTEQLSIDAHLTTRALTRSASGRSSAGKQESSPLGSGSNAGVVKKRRSLFHGRSARSRRDKTSSSTPSPKPEGVPQCSPEEKAKIEECLKKCAKCGGKLKNASMINRLGGGYLRLGGPVQTKGGPAEQPTRPRRIGPTLSFEQEVQGLVPPAETEAEAQAKHDPTACKKCLECAGDCAIGTCECIGGCCVGTGRWFADLCDKQCREACCYVCVSCCWCIPALCQGCG